MKSKAHLAGAILGVTAMSGFVLWQRSRPAPCTGGVTIELRPPLGDPGPYRFRLVLDGIEQPCEFDVPWPIRGRVDTSSCGHVVELGTRVQGTESKIVGLTVGASPEAFEFRVMREGETLYDTKITPTYGPYETPKSESRLFCGQRALVVPACVRGSSGCAPYEPVCDGPEDCTNRTRGQEPSGRSETWLESERSEPSRQGSNRTRGQEPSGGSNGKACCASPDWGREYGPLAATECSSTRRCLDRFGFVACHADSDCPSDMTCTDRSIEKDFKRPVTTCEPRKTAAK